MKIELQNLKVNLVNLQGDETKRNLTTGIEDSKNFNGPDFHLKELKNADKLLLSNLLKDKQFTDMEVKKEKFSDIESYTFNAKGDNLLQFHLIPTQKRASEVHITMKKPDQLYEDRFTIKTTKIADIEHDLADWEKIKENFAKILNEKIIPKYRGTENNLAK